MRQEIPPDANTSPGDEITDEMLIHAIKNNATWAMEPLYQRHSRLLYSLIYHMVSDTQTAEDLLQETFVLVWKRASYYSPNLGTVRKWLTTIARNRTIDYIRHEKRHTPGTDAPLEDVDLDPNTAQPSAMDEALDSIQADQIRRALMTLPIEQRMVIELAYFQGWTREEIAQGCKIPTGTVKSRIKLGINRLRILLKIHT